MIWRATRVVFWIVVILSIMCLMWRCEPGYAGTVDLEKIVSIESNGQPDAFNPISKAVGAFQFTAICVRDFNQINDTKVKLTDMYDEAKAAHIAIWYLEERLPQLIKAAGYKDTINNRIIGWNCGVSCLGKPLPRETLNYIRKYHGHTNQKN